MINANKKMESTIEASFYPDDQQSYPSRERLKRLKKSMTLDLESPSPKKQKFSCLLSTPDLNMLKLASPELERLLIQQNGLVTGTTPTPGQYAFPKSVTEEQESYVQGFVEALAQLHDSKKGSGADSESGGGLGRDESSNSSCEETSNSGASTSMSSGNISTNAQTHFNLSGHGVKEEPQTVPRRARSPPMSPINLVDQERIKLERKRLRNRLAATKCRQMKLEKISKLEQRVKELKGDNDELSGLVSKLRDRICFLKEQLMEHVNNGCKVMVPQELLD